MRKTDNGHTFEAYRIFDGAVDKSGKLSDIVWAKGVETTDIAAALANAGLTVPGGKDLSKAADVAQVLSGLTDDSDVMKKVADVFYARKGTVTDSASTKNSDGNYVIGSWCGYLIPQCAGSCR